MWMALLGGGLVGRRDIRAEFLGMKRGSEVSVQGT